MATLNIFVDGKNSGLKTLIEETPTKEQYSVVKDFLAEHRKFKRSYIAWYNKQTGSSYTKDRDLVWSIINMLNDQDELDLEI